PSPPSDLSLLQAPEMRYSFRETRGIRGRPWPSTDIPVPGHARDSRRGAFLCELPSSRPRPESSVCRSNAPERLRTILDPHFLLRRKPCTAPLAQWPWRARDCSWFAFRHFLRLPPSRAVQRLPCEEFSAAEQSLFLCLSRKPA